MPPRTSTFFSIFGSFRYNFNIRRRYTMKFSMNEHGFTGHLPFGELHVSTDEEYGFRPYQLLVSSLAICSAGIIRKV